MKENSLSLFAEEEPWDSYFERRYLEFLSYHDYLRNFQAGKVLEIGCGLGYTSAFLGAISGSVTATDLPACDSDHHALGIERARRFVAGLGLENIHTVAASAESLPFSDNSFDLVFSSHVMEHVPNKELAVREIHRVLKPGGVHFCVTPTRTERAYAFLIFQLYIVKRALYHVSRLFRIKHPCSLNAVHDLRQNTRKQLRHFPFPPVHGTDSHYLLELRGWSFRRWKSLLKGDGVFTVLGQYSTQLSPLLIVGAIFFPKIATKSHSITRRIELLLGRIPALRGLGINCITITRKIERKT